MELLKLLDSRNKCLQRILTCSSQFIESAKSGDVSKINEFEKERSAIFKAITLFDKKIHETSPDFSSGDQINSALQVGDRLIQAIIAQDESILEIIESEKNRISKELRDSQKYNNTVNKFKSKWVPELGETLDGKL